MKNSFQGLLSEKQFFNVMTCASKEITFFGASSILSGVASFLGNFYKVFCTPVKNQFWTQFNTVVAHPYHIPGTRYQHFPCAS